MLTKPHHVSHIAPAAAAEHSKEQHRGGYIEEGEEKESVYYWLCIFSLPTGYVRASYSYLFSVTAAALRVARKAHDFLGAC